MSGINSTIRINDGMSPALKSMNNALNIVISSFEDLQKISGKSVDASSIKSARVELSNAAMAVNKLENELIEAGEKQKMLTNEVRKTDSSMLSLIKRATALAMAYASINSIVNVSDRMSQTQSRLQLIVDDEGSVEELEKEIMASANRAKSSYLDTADVISKMALRAGDAFSEAGKVDMTQVVAFTETLNKMYKIAGASSEEQASSMLQLTQALGSGVLRGEEFNAVFEAAPNVMQAVADYMNVPIGKLRDMASEGLISSEVVKNAIFDATEQVNKDFESMKLTWGSLWELMQNKLFEVSQSVLTYINDLANNESVQTFLTGMAVAIGYVGQLIVGAFSMLGSIAGFVYNNWSFIAPVIYSAIIALGVYYGYLLLVRAIELITIATTMAMNFAKALLATVTWIATSATWAEATAQYALNGALYACPIVWILMLIIVIIAVIYLVIAAINRVAGTTFSATGLIAGVVMWLFALIYNTCVGVLNSMIQVVWSIFVDPFIGILEWCLNVANGGFNSFGGAVANLIGQIISWFLSLGKIVTKIIDAIFGTDWTGGLESLQDSVLAWGKNEDKAVTLERNAPEIKRMDMTDSFNKGYNFGKGLIGDIKNKFSIKEPKTPKAGNGINIPNVPDYNSLAPTTPNNPTDKVKVPSSGSGAGVDNLSDKVGKISDDTGKISDNMDITDEDLKYLRDIAEKEAINRFTTAEIKVEMGGVNNVVNERSDLDGIVNYLEEKLYQTMLVASEGV